ncbi:DUF5069 domain-containing protein [Prosthecobacter sp.]|uniref:DUF5069 domain-containing protein n=1 Tax=Prosthecobacter sp. TaxID=1965333 RepID=UPI003784A786
MNDLTWDTTFCELFERCAKLHRGGDTRAVNWYTEADQTFLDGIGYTAQEFFDFVDDHCRYGSEGPTLATSLLVAAVRRDFFRVVQNSQRSEKTVPPGELPPKTAAVEGMPWLPRLIVKARAKLKGEMDPDTMYGCGGDRAFFEQHKLHPADFLRVTWAAGDDDQKIIDYVKTGKM